MQWLCSPLAIFGRLLQVAAIVAFWIAMGAWLLAVAALMLFAIAIVFAAMPLAAVFLVVMVVAAAICMAAFLAVFLTLILFNATRTLHQSLGCPIPSMLGGPF